MNYIFGERCCGLGKQCSSDYLQLVGTAGNAGTAGKIFVGANNTGLTAIQLSQIQFDGFTPGAQILSTGEVVPRFFTLVLFDHFNRVPATNTVGQPSNGGPPDWTEMESIASGAQVNGAAMWLQSGVSNQREAISYDMTAYYPVTFDESTEDMIWAWNMQSNVSDPSGFTTSNYGSAFILGATRSAFDNSQASGYAVILGETGSNDSLRLVRFGGGLGGVATIKSKIAAVKLSDNTIHFSVNVTYTSCTHTWNMIVREESIPGWTNPSIGAFSLSDSGVDTVLTATELPYLGTFWKHNSDGTRYMKIDNIYIPEPTLATDNEYTWNGGTGDYNTPSNWTPDRDCARARDVLIFDGGTSEITDIPNQTIGQIIVQNNASVTFRNFTTGAASILKLTGGTGQDLIVESGSVLNLDVKNTVSGNGMVIDMLTATTGEIAGKLTFINTKSTGGRHHQLLVTDTDALHIKNGGRVEAIDLLLGNNPFGDSRGGNAVVFENGSTYLHGSGANPFGDGSPPSKVVFETGSWYHFTSPNLPSVSGRVFANFRYEAGTLDLVGTNNYFIDTLQVLQGTANFKLNATATIAGDIEVASGATLNFNPLTGTAIVRINAPVVQNIFGTGNMTIGTGVTLNLQNTNRINIQKNITITGIGPANILANAVVDFEGENYFSGSGSTIVQNNSKVYLGSSGGIAIAPTAAGNIRTTTRTFSAQAAYVYSGSVNQITGTGLPATLTGFGKLEIDNSGTIANNTVTLTRAGTTTTPLLTLTNGLFAVGAPNTLAITAGGAINSTVTSNFASGNLAGTVAFNGVGTVNASGDLDFWTVNLLAGTGGVNFGNLGTPNIQNELVINSGRWVDTNSPAYAVGSNLVYNNGGNYTIGKEWYDNNSTGRGVPYNVQVGRSGVNNTKLYFDNSVYWRYCRGSMNIGDGIGTGYEFYLGTATGGDLKLEGDFILNDNSVFGANQRAVFFVGSAIQTITSNATGNEVDFDYMIVDKPGSELLLDDSPGTTVNALGSSGGNVLVLSEGDFNLQGQTFNLGGSGPVLLVRNGDRTVLSSSPANFNVIGAKEVQSSNSGALFFDNLVTVNIAAGMNFGADITTINATLQINSGGFANTNAPRYGPQGVLKYNTGADPYIRRVEWNGSEGNPGFPNDVIVAGGTVLNPGGDPVVPNTGTDFGARRDVTIEAGSAIYMDYGGDDMTVPLKVGRNLTIDGSLSASDEIGGDIYVGGNWLRNASGIFNPKDRQVLFNGTTAQTITADGGETFDYLGFANTGTKDLLSDITVNKKIEFIAGTGALSGDGQTIHLLGDWQNDAGETAFAEANTTVSFEGSQLQTVSCDLSTFEGFDNVKIANSGPGIYLDNNASVSGQLEFVDGLIDATVNRVDFQNDATNTGSGDASYINGFAKKIGFTNGNEFMFPVGQYDDTDPMNIIDVYQPAALIPTNTSATAAFTVDYNHTSYFPGYTDPNNLPPMQSPLVKVSTCNYWNINRTATGTDAYVKLYWTDACLDINDPTSLVVAKVNGGQWESHGQSGVNSTAPYASGYVVSQVVTTFSPFAIGSTDGINVLPIELLSFTASAKNDLVETQWVTSTEINNDYFTVERSVDATNFEEVGRLDGAGNSTTQLSYGFIDDAPYPGISYYRLKQTDFDGMFSYSDIRAVEIDGDHGFELLQVYRSESGLNLTYRSEAPRLHAAVFDLLGQQLFQAGIDNTNGRSVIYPSLARGVYLLRLSNGVEEKVMKFFW